MVQFGSLMDIERGVARVSPVVQDTENEDAFPFALPSSK